MLAIFSLFTLSLTELIIKIKIMALSRGSRMNLGNNDT